MFHRAPSDAIRMQSAHEMLTEAIQRARILMATLEPVISNDFRSELGAIIELMRDSRGECSND
jgi:hypothetical protein